MFRAVIIVIIIITEEDIEREREPGVKDHENNKRIDI